MTYASDTAKSQHRVGYYIAFEGISTRIATHPMASYGVSGTFLDCIVEDSLTGGERRLDRNNHVVEDGGLSWTCIASASVLTLFRRRGGDESTIGAVSASATTITDESGSNTWANGTNIHVGREVITLGTHVGSGSYTGCTRGALGSTAIAHDAGERASDVPLFWYTRACTLYAVNLDTGTEKALWYGSLSSAPVFRNGTIEFAASGRMDDICNRPLMSGFREVDVASASYSGGTLVTLDFHAASDEYEFATGSYGGFVLVTAGDKRSIYRFLNTDVGSGQLIVDVSAQVVPSSDASDLGYSSTGRIIDPNEITGSQVKVRQVALVSGYLGRAIASVVTSRYGDETNGAWDVLPGRAPNVTSASDDYFRRRIGAAVPSTWVDIATLQQMTAGSQFDEYWLVEPEKVGDFLYSQAWRTGGYFYIDDDGKLSWQLYAPYTSRGGLPAHTATSEWLVSDAVAWDDEDSAPATALIEANYDPFTQTFKRKLTAMWSEEVPIYGDRAESIAYRTKGLRIGDSSVAGYTQIEAGLERVRARRRHAGRRVSYLLPWKYHNTLIPGYRFTLTDSRLPDGEGGTGISGRAYEVVAWRPDFGAGTVTVECDELPRGWLLGVSAQVASWSSPTLTLSTSGNYGNGFLADDAAIGQDFIVNCGIRVYDASATPPFSASTTLTVTAKSNSTLTTSGTPSFTPAAGDIVVIEDSADTGNTNDVSADVQDFAFGADSSYLIGTGTGYERAGTRWT